MESGLIGFSGFVGSNLCRQTTFDRSYNSKNIHEIYGKTFGLLVCAGVSAEKWIANRAREEDRRRIQELTTVLAKVKAHEFLLISTIDVYPNPEVGGDEATIIDGKAGQPYSRNRYELEQWARQIFPICRIVRLPALFGPGLKKNALFDLLHDNQVAAINPAGLFQWYPVRRLWSDIEITRRANLRLVNLFTEPLPMGRIIETFFSKAAVGPLRRPAPVYRVATAYAELFGGADGFILSADACLAEIAAFISAERVTH